MSQMTSPLSASSNPAGALMSNATFIVPPFQRDYAWGDDEVDAFLSDIHNSLDEDSYFLGLIILTREENSFQVVDGQQRIITLTLLATALYHEANMRDRRALADRIQSDFLRTINYETDHTDPRVRLSDTGDNATLQRLLDTGEAGHITEGDLVSARMAESYDQIRTYLRQDLAKDPFKQLGRWTDFITNRLYFAVFIHPDPNSAYQVFEVINTRGKELTTADLLKNYMISQTPVALKQELYDQWKRIAGIFPSEGGNNFVQYIRHIVTAEAGYVLPKDLFGFLAQRVVYKGKTPPSPHNLMKLLEDRLPLYMQMIDPTSPGPAETDALRVFAALNTLGVITVRPILLAMSDVPDALNGMRFILKLVVSRVIVGTLGTGNVERRFGEAARKISDSKRWESIVDDLNDLMPTDEDFKRQLERRSLSKGVLEFVRRSVVQGTITPEQSGVAHLIAVKHGAGWSDLTDDEKTTWLSTIGNSFLANMERRPRDVTDWQSFKALMLPHAVNGEWVEKLRAVDHWDVAAISSLGSDLAEAARRIWYR